MKNEYSDIIDLPHHVSTKHSHMRLIDRAAQFAPFAALSGYEQAVHETARLTDPKLSLSEERISSLNDVMHVISDALREGRQPRVQILYFIPDKQKDGGRYEAYEGTVRRVDDFARALIFTDASSIALDSVYDISVKQ